jgi:hypothetical protein
MSGYRPPSAPTGRSGGGQPYDVVLDEPGSPDEPTVSLHDSPPRPPSDSAPTSPRTPRSRRSLHAWRRGRPTLRIRRGPWLRRLLLTCAVLLVVLLVAAAAIGLLNRTGTATGRTDPTLPTTAPPVAVPVPAGNPSEAVRSYLLALASGQAAAALQVSEDQPSERSLLTDAVLKKSLSRAPITDIRVPLVTDQNAFSVGATYRLGGNTVTESFSVIKVGDSWKLTRTFTELDLSDVRLGEAPIRVNGTPVTKGRVNVFPGAYEVASGSPYVSYGSDNQIVLNSPSAYAPTTSLKPTLTERGRKAFLRTAQAGLEKCLEERTLSPKGCPFAVEELPGQQIEESSVRWALAEDPWSGINPRLDFEQPEVATASASMVFEFSASGTSGKTKTQYGPQKVYRFVTFAVDMTKDPLDVTMSR